MDEIMRIATQVRKRQASSEVSQDPASCRPRCRHWSAAAGSPTRQELGRRPEPQQKTALQWACVLESELFHLTMKRSDPQLVRSFLEKSWKLQASRVQQTGLASARNPPKQPPQQPARGGRLCLLPCL